jgi:hypothetical protein
MNHLTRLMAEFAILGMEPEAAPVPTDLPVTTDDPTAVADQEEYILDANGNPVLDEQGNPIRKVAPPSDALALPTPEGDSCTCNDTAAPTDNPMDVRVSFDPMASLGTDPNSVSFPTEPEDEFDFNI